MKEVDQERGTQSASEDVCGNADGQQHVASVDIGSGQGIDRCRSSEGQRADDDVCACQSVEREEDEARSSVSRLDDL